MEENWKLVSELNDPERIIESEFSRIVFPVPDSVIQSAKGVVNSESIINYVLENLQR